MILSHDTTVFTTDPRVEVLRFMVIDVVLVVFSVVLVIHGGFEDPLSRQHGPQSCGEYIVATTVHS